MRKIDGIGKKPHTILCKDGSTVDTMSIVLFNYFPHQYNILSNIIGPGATILVSGRPTYSKYDGALQMLNPDFILSDTQQNMNKIMQIEPVYSLTEGNFLLCKHNDGIETAFCFCNLSPFCLSLHYFVQYR